MIQKAGAAPSTHSQRDFLFLSLAQAFAMLTSRHSRQPPPWNAFFDEASSAARPLVFRPKVQRLLRAKRKKARRTSKAPEKPNV